MATMGSTQTPFPWAIMNEVSKDFSSRPAHVKHSPSNSTSSTSSDKIRILDLSQHEASMRQTSLEHGYLSSEEDLSPLSEDFEDAESFRSFDLDDELDDDNEDFDLDYDIDQAFHMYSGESENPWRETLAAREVEIVYSGRPKIVDIPPTPATSPTTSKPQTRDTSLDLICNMRQRPRTMMQRDVTGPPAYVFAKALAQESDGSSSNSEVAYNDHRDSSIYSVNPPSPSFFNGLQHNLASDRSSIISEAPVLGAPIVPTMPQDASTTQPQSRHSRVKSLSRIGLFKNKKTRKDSLTSTSMVQLANANTQPERRPPPPPLQLSTTFAPSPIVRPQGRLVARGAIEHDDDADSRDWNRMLSGLPRHQEQQQHFGDDEMSDHEDSMDAEQSWAAKVGKRKSLLAFAF